MAHRLEKKKGLSLEDRIKKDKAEMCLKFGQAFMEFFYYFTFTLIGLAIVPSQPFFWPSKLWWSGFHTGEHFVMQQDMRYRTAFLFHVVKTPTSLPRDEAFGLNIDSKTLDRCYYIAYAARYLQGSISCFLEPKRKDFVEMQIHHIATVLLVSLSYCYGWVRVGVMVSFHCPSFPSSKLTPRP